MFFPAWVAKRPSDGRIWNSLPRWSGVEYNLAHISKVKTATHKSWKRKSLPENRSRTPKDCPCLYKYAAFGCPNVILRKESGDAHRVFWTFVIAHCSSFCISGIKSVKSYRMDESHMHTHNSAWLDGSVFEPLFFGLDHLIGTLCVSGRGKW